MGAMYEDVIDIIQPMVEGLADLVCTYIEENEPGECYAVCPKCANDEYENGEHCDYFGLYNEFVTERICKHCGCVYTLTYKLAEVSEIETE